MEVTTFIFVMLGVMALVAAQVTLVVLLLRITHRRKAAPPSPNTPDAALRFAVMERDRFRCTICGTSSEEGARLEVDYLVPPEQGGKAEPDNLRTICTVCKKGLQWNTKESPLLNQIPPTGKKEPAP